MPHWLMKTEPDDYSWERLVADGGTAWSGVRNYLASNNLKAMKLGERAFFYRSVVEPAIVGVMTIVREAYPVPGDEASRWVQVDVEPVLPAKTEVSLKTIKGDPRFADIILLKQSRLSVAPVTDEHWSMLCELAGIKA